MTDPLLILVSVGLLSIGCQFLAYRIKIPAILPLLIVGLAVGPGFNLLNPDELFGDILFPIVSLSVAIILFEGALTLELSDIAGHGKMVRNLCSVGVLITWIIAAVAAHMIIEIPWPLAFLFGALVTVTGPTVIVPMLRTVRPTSNIANILRWEGIVIDPIGALLAVLVFEYIVSSQGAISHTLYAFAITLATGFGLGGIAGYGLGFVLKKKWIPLYLENTAALTIILGFFAASNALAHESGLLTVTIAGMVLANMKQVDVSRIVEFKETLSVLLISGLFILLASRIELSTIYSLGVPALGVVAVIVFVARPIAVATSSLGTDLSKKELALLAWIAPRGIVAAAVSALFSLKLEEIGYQGASALVPMVFLIIVCTVVIQSLSAKQVAIWLNVRAKPPSGYLLFGGNLFARMLAKELQNQKIDVCVADTNWDAVKKARMQELPVYFGNPMSEHASLNLEISSFANVLILSPYRQLNPLVGYHFETILGKGKVLALTNNEQSSRPSHQVSETYAETLSLFDEGITYGYLASAVSHGAVMKTTNITEEFSFASYLDNYGARAIPLIAIDELNKSYPFATTRKLELKPGWRVISLILADRESTTD